MHGYQDRNVAARCRSAVGAGDRLRGPVVVIRPRAVRTGAPVVSVGLGSPAFVAAQEAMASSCKFLIRRGIAGHATASRRPIHGKVVLRRAGNCLRELDRLLSILLDECVGAGGMAESKRRAFERSHDTPRKLRRVDRLNGRFTVDTIRLRAIERIKEVACNDQVLALVPWTSHDMAMATAGLSRARRSDLDQGRARPWEITDEALGAIARFYLSIANRVLGYYGVPGAQLDFSTDDAHVISAIVACDGI